MWVVDGDCGVVLVGVVFGFVGGVVVVEFGVGGGGSVVVGVVGCLGVGFV